MAASESKSDQACTSETPKNEDVPCSELPGNDYPECNQYRSLDVIFYALTIAIFAATVVTDCFVVIEHWLNTYKSWAYYTVVLAFVPSCFVQILSLKWYQSSGSLRRNEWISHIFHFAIMHRFCSLLNSAIKMMKTQVSPQERDCIFRIENDAFTLNLFTSLLVSIPQIVFQVYIMAILQHISFWTSASVITSLCSLTWALTSYTLLINRTNQDKSQFTWSFIMIQGFWRGGMLASRIAALVLAAICFKAWILVIFVVHVLGMTLWIIQQTRNFCLSAVEELAYKCLIGAVYFFDFLRLTDTQVRYYVCIFYSVMIVQNAVLYVTYLVSFKDLFQTNILIISTVLILGGTFVGAISMLIHFCMFQNVKPIKLYKRTFVDPEVSSNVSPKKTTSKSPNKKWNNESPTGEAAHIIAPDITADKKSLLTNIVQNSDLLEKGIFNMSFEKNDETNVTVQVEVEDNKVANVDVSIENLQNNSMAEKKFEDTYSVNLAESIEQPKSSNTDSLHRQKRRGICSEIELDLKTNKCNLDLDSQTCSQKRRGICSLTQLGLELVTDEDNYVEKSFSSLDKLKSNSEISVNIKDKSMDSGILDALPIKSLISGDNSDPMIPVNILVRGRLNTPISETTEIAIPTQLSEKNENLQKQEEETLSHVTSIHDYENLCPLGVARPPWCIRSWKGYTDIETYIHDDSVVRDRRRDTLTSTATGTTISSDFSESTYTNLPLKKLMKRSRQDDYLDTLIYDLVDWESISNKASIDEQSVINTTAATIISESVNEPQDQSNLFSAKPIVIDEKGGMLTLDTIIEEREDTGLSNLRMSFSNRSSCTVSSLVATIDEIRKGTAENSPRHIYHHTESQWEDLEQKFLVKKTHLAKVLFANDYTNVTLSYSDPWASPFFSEGNSDKLSIIREMTNCCLNDTTGKTPLINAILSDSPILGSKTDSQNYESGDILEEDNVYVDMNALGAQACSNEEHKELEMCQTEKDIVRQQNDALDIHNGSDIKESADGRNRKKVAFLFTEEVINSTSDTSSESCDISSTKTVSDFNVVPCLTDNEQKSVNRPRRKFSLLRERFEPKSSDQIVCVVSPTSRNKILKSRPQLSSLNKRISVIINDSEPFDSSLNYDKENLTSKSVIDGKGEYSDNIREKRSVFLKQVLSPPKLQGWGKKRTFSPNAKIIPKAH